MNIIYTKSYEKALKKLKKYKKEYENLYKILKIIRNTKDFKELSNLPIVNIYGFERLKHQYNDFYSFNLNKNGGKIRLIIKPNNINEMEIYIVFISYEHYKDFDIKKVINYDE